MNRLQGRCALVIGGSTGIGREVCRLYALEGADVAVGDIGHSDEKASLVEEIVGLGGKAFDIEVDVTREEQVAGAIATAISRFGRIDILVNNAGIGGIHQSLELETSEHYDRMMAVTLKGVWLGMKYVLPHMLERGNGRIVNTASQLAHKVSPLNASYCAAKAGVVALTGSVVSMLSAPAQLIRQCGAPEIRTGAGGKRTRFRLSESLGQLKLPGLTFISLATRRATCLAKAYPRTAETYAGESEIKSEDEANGTSPRRRGLIAASRAKTSQARSDGPSRRKDDLGDPLYQ
jgi:NAD(P)-dependent dehydrogenase (short-subunit alcohol dehydrogenase family)